MSAVKRHLEVMTDEVLNSVRMTGAAVLVEREPMKKRSTFCPAPDSTLKQALEIARGWLAGPTIEDSARLARMERQLGKWQSAAPPDFVIDYLDLLQELVDDFVTILNEWMAPYELRAGWDEGALIIKHERDWS